MRSTVKFQQHIENQVGITYSRQPEVRNSFNNIITPVIDWLADMTVLLFNFQHFITCLLINLLAKIVKALVKM